MANCLTSTGSEGAVERLTKCRQKSTQASSTGRRVSENIQHRTHIDWEQEGDLRVIQYNIRSWNKNKVEFLHDMDILKPHVIMIQESWLTSENLRECKVPGYFVARRDRTRSRKGIGERVCGGGLLILVKCCAKVMDYIKIEQLPSLNFPHDDTTEILQIKIYWNERAIVFTNIYVPPMWGGEGESRTQNFLASNVLSRCMEGHFDSEHIFGGDFNGHHPSWDSGGCDSEDGGSREEVIGDIPSSTESINIASDRIGDDVYEWTLDNNVHVMNNPNIPTFISSNASGRKSSPDVTMCTSSTTIHSWGVVRRLASDHLVIGFSVSNTESVFRSRNRCSRVRKTRLSFKKADWLKFNALFLEGVVAFNKSTRKSKIHRRYKNLVRAFDFASSVIPRGSRIDAMSWWDDELNELKKRKDACGWSENKELFVALSKELNELITIKKAAAWKEFASTLSYSSNPSRTARVIKHIGREQSAPESIVLKSADGSKVLLSDLDKAIAFRGVYAKECRNSHEVMNRTEKGKRRESKSRIKNYCRLAYIDIKSQFTGLGYGSRGYFPPLKSDPADVFSLNELDAAIGELKKNKACGDDGICNEMLINLDARNRMYVLSAVNSSWTAGESYSGWNIGTIRPLAKPGKDKSLLSSYRPVCLMSVVAKLAERLITNRLRYDLESRGVLTNLQAAFRRGRCTNDVTMSLVNDAIEGFTKTRPTQTTASLIDFSRAFDKVNHSKLLNEFENLLIPACFGRWYRSFLTDRKYCVHFGTAKSTFVRFANGVPQGSVSGPLLFVIYTVSLISQLEKLECKGLRVAMFADDLTIWHSSSSISCSCLTLQLGLDIVQKWSFEYGMPLSDGKTEAIYFSRARVRPEFSPGLLFLKGEPVNFKSQVRLLGIIMDSKLNSSGHAIKIKKEASWRLSQMSKVCGKSWGGNSLDLKSFYLAYVASLFDYSASSWAPLLSKTNVKQLEIIQNRAARLITGCLGSTRIKSLLLEAGLLPLELRFQYQCMIAAERCRRLPISDPLHVRAFNACRKKKGICSWREKSTELFQGIQTQLFQGDRNTTALLNISCREALLMFPQVPPWLTSSVSRVEFYPTLENKSVCAGSDHKFKKTASLDTLLVRGIFDVECWTDGSVVDKVGAGAACLYYGEKKVTIITPAGYLCSSYQAELMAIKAALVTIDAKLDGTKKAYLFCTDSQSSINALLSGPLVQTTTLASSVWRLILRLVNDHPESKVVFQFIYSHCGVSRNEEADRAADNALKDPRSTSAQEKCGIPLEAVKAHVKLSLKNSWIATHDEGAHRSFISKKPTNLRRTKALGRLDEVLLHQLRTGECRLAGKFRKRIALTDSESCRWCLREEETIIHMFSTCKGLAKLRREQDIKDQMVLSLNEIKSLFFFRSALDLLEASNGEHLEELRRSEDIEDAIAAGAVTVRRKKT